MFNTSDTIVAIATPPGRGGIGVVRLSGRDSPEIARRLTRRSAPLVARHATFAHVHDLDAPAETGRPVDQVVVTWFARPHSYTAEDVVELSAHGSPVLLARILGLAVRAGARLAEPGEFTLRAYLNGRIDLVQAEAVCDLVAAVTPLQARAAMDQLEGTLTGLIGEVDGALFDLCARLEASLDFPDEGFHFIAPAAATAALAAVIARLRTLSTAGHAGRLIREGSLVVIAGAPNAGKSSLFNALVGSARAIVADVPGTTRDLLTETVDLGGLPVTIVDTAGLRDSADRIEVEGVRRAREAQSVAALTLLVIDGSVPLDATDRALIDQNPAGPRLLVLTKADLPRGCRDQELSSLAGALSVSAVTGEGLDGLRQQIVLALTGRDEWRDPPALSNARHVRLVEEALAVVEHAAGLLDRGATEELVLAELAAARRALEAVTGTRGADDMLNHIFTRFCVGK
ncbi:MAG: tRNA uridine-5-carboxymethylaminomethyl(34) synthesis GTPase MnmE [Vicinamibacterales bacterium]